MIPSHNVNSDIDLGWRLLANGPFGILGRFLSNFMFLAVKAKPDLKKMAMDNFRLFC